MATRTATKTDQSQEPGNPSRSPPQLEEVQACGVSPAVCPRCCRELDRKWNTRTEPSAPTWDTSIAALWLIISRDVTCSAGRGKHNDKVSESIYHIRVASKYGNNYKLLLGVQCLQFWYTHWLGKVQMGRITDSFICPTTRKKHIIYLISF